MKRQTQNTLYHLLPVAFWLLASGGIVLWALFSPFVFHWCSLVPSLFALPALIIIRRIPRHTESVEQCFVVALMLGIAAYWLPTVVFLLLPIWGYLIYQNIFSFRSFLASVLGLAVIAIWAAVLTRLDILSFPFSLEYNLCVWFPTASVLLAWLGTTIVRQTLRVR